jgi:dephospho-CoA kinase
MLKIGLTGGIASGKSQVCRYFTELGIEVIDSDKVARELFKPKSAHLEKLKAQFGEQIFLSNGELDRKALGKIVFSDQQLLDWLNQFTHPLINTEMKRQLANSQSAYVVLDIPLLINKQGNIPEHLNSLIDRVLVINTDLETQIDRILKRDRISEKEALNIINAQSTIQQKLLLADDIINNNASLQELNQQVNRLHEQYLKHGMQ